MSTLAHKGYQKKLKSMVRKITIHVHRPTQPPINPRRTWLLDQAVDPKEEGRWYSARYFLAKNPFWKIGVFREDWFSRKDAQVRASQSLWFFPAITLKKRVLYSRVSRVFRVFNLFLGLTSKMPKTKHQSKEYLPDYHGVWEGGI